MKEHYSRILVHLKKPKSIVSIAFAFFAILTVATYPSFFASVDEHEYLRNSFLLQKGTLTEPDITKICTGKFNGEGYISQYFIGRSIFLIPFTLLGFGAVMLSGLAIHLINTALFYRILQKLKYNPAYTLLYIFYPAFLWEARTLNSELLALSGVLAATLFYLSDDRRQQILCGLLLGLSSLVRQETLLLAVPFMLVALARDRKKFIFITAGIIPALVIIFFSNQFFYGGILSSGYGSPIKYVTSIGSDPSFFPNAAKFVLLLCIAYPLMLLGPAFSKKLKWETILACVIFILFYSQNAGISKFPTFSPTAFTGQLRYVIPAIGLLMLSYPVLIEKALNRIKIIPRAHIFAIGCVMLVASCVAASTVHAGFLDGRHQIFEDIYNHTSTNSLIIGNSDDCNYILNEIFDDRAYINFRNENMTQFLGRYGEVYLLDINYGTVDYSSQRGSAIAGEREAMREFIKSLGAQQVFYRDSPNRIAIYKLMRPAQQPTQSHQ